MKPKPRQFAQFDSHAPTLIIGRGRVARHFQHYLSLEGISYSSWSRTEREAALHERASFATRILILISDDAIEDFLNRYPFITEKMCVHFSGCLVSPRIVGAHPLMTFGEQLYDLDTYRRIPFIVEESRRTFSELLPGLTNPSYAIPAEKKALYHALCVIAGNFSIVLWEKLFTDFSKELGLPKEAVGPYLECVFSNLAQSPLGTSVLTGPLQRGDEKTIEANLHALQNDPFAEVYRSFVRAYRADNNSI